MHFFEEVLDLSFNLNIHGINTDNISITGPPRLFINPLASTSAGAAALKLWRCKCSDSFPWRGQRVNGMLFPSGINLVKILYNIKTRANNIVKYSFFPIIPQIIGNFDIFI